MRTATIRSLIGLVVAGALVAPATFSMVTPVLADPRADQEIADREAAEASAILEHATERAQEAAARYATANAALPAAQARVGEARGEVVAAQVRARTAEREAEQAQQELAAASDRFDESAAAVDEARDQVAAFAVAAYKGSGVASFNLLLQARDPGEMLDRLGYVEQVATSQRSALDQFAGARVQARQVENEASVARDRAEATRRAMAAALAQAEATQAAAEAAAAEVVALTETRAEALAVAEQERVESLSRYEQAQAEADRIAAEVREWETARHSAGTSAGSSGSSGSGALLEMPSQGWLSSPYGMRHDPFFGVHQMHAGIDIAAPGGTPIYAAEAGTVINSGWYGGYGNFTCLGHGTHQGQGLSTCYAHQSQILVSGGQSVERGELIGRVGTTGASTGNHLHFEVRLDGSPTDPVPFLPR